MSFQRSSFFSLRRQFLLLRRKDLEYAASFATVTTHVSTTNLQCDGTNPESTSKIADNDHLKSTEYPHSTGITVNNSTLIKSYNPKILISNRIDGPNGCDKMNKVLYPLITKQSLKVWDILDDSLNNPELAREIGIVALTEICKQMPIPNMVRNKLSSSLSSSLSSTSNTKSNMTSSASLTTSTTMTDLNMRIDVFGYYFAHWISRMDYDSRRWQVPHVFSKLCSQFNFNNNNDHDNNSVVQVCIAIMKHLSNIINKSTIASSKHESKDVGKDRINSENVRSIDDNTMADDIKDFNNIDASSNNTSSSDGSSHSSSDGSSISTSTTDLLSRYIIGDVAISSFFFLQSTGCLTEGLALLTQLQSLGLLKPDHIKENAFAYLMQTATNMWTPVRGNSGISNKVWHLPSSSSSSPKQDGEGTGFTEKDQRDTLDVLLNLAMIDDSKRSLLLRTRFIYTLHEWHYPFVTEYVKRIIDRGFLLGTRVYNYYMASLVAQGRVKEAMKALDAAVVEKKRAQKLLFNNINDNSLMNSIDSAESLTNDNHSINFNNNNNSKNHTITSSKLSSSFPSPSVTAISDNNSSVKVKFGPTIHTYLILLDIYFSRKRNPLKHPNRRPDDKSVDESLLHTLVCRAFSDGVKLDVKFLLMSITIAKIVHHRGLADAVMQYVQNHAVENITADSDKDNNNNNNNKRHHESIQSMRYRTAVLQAKAIAETFVQPPTDSYMSLDDYDDENYEITDIDNDNDDGDDGINQSNVSKLLIDTNDWCNLFYSAFTTYRLVAVAEGRDATQDSLDFLQIMILNNVPIKSTIMEKIMSDYIIRTDSISTASTIINYNNNSGNGNYGSNSSNNNPRIPNTKVYIRNSSGSYQNKKRLNQVLDMFEKSESQWGCVRTPQHAGLFIEALLRLGRLSDAVQAFEHIISRSSNSRSNNGNSSGSNNNNNIISSGNKKTNTPKIYRTVKMIESENEIPLSIAYSLFCRLLWLSRYNSEADRRAKDTASKTKRKNIHDLTILHEKLVKIIQYITSRGNLKSSSITYQPHNKSDKSKIIKISLEQELVKHVRLVLDDHVDSKTLTLSNLLHELSSSSESNEFIKELAQTCLEKFTVSNNKIVMMVNSNNDSSGGSSSSGTNISDDKVDSEKLDNDHRHEKDGNDDNDVIIPLASNSSTSQDTNSSYKLRDQELCSIDRLIDSIMNDEIYKN